MRQLPRTLAPALLALLFLASSGSRVESCGQGNAVVINDGFNMNIAGWSSTQGFGTATWSSTDWGESSASGSLLLSNTGAIAGQNLSVSRCDAITPGVNYAVGARIHPNNWCCNIEPASPRATRHTGSLYALLNFYTKANCAGSPLFTFVRLDADGTNIWQTKTQTFPAPASAISVRTTLGIFKDQAGDDLNGLFDDVYLMPADSTPQDPTVLCFGDRFQVQARWTTRDGTSGVAQAVPLTTDTGYFYFFNSDNVELIVKVLNGCGFNSRFWVFAGGLTDVQVVLTVTDTTTGAVLTYNNPQGTAFVPIQDTNAFAACSSSGAAEEAASAPPIDFAALLPARPVAPEPRVSDAGARPLATAEAACVPNSTTLCLNQGRFSVTTRWTKPDGTTGQGQAVARTADTGLFWFFTSNNIEMVVKILNGCGVDSAYWVFAGGLTNVQVVMTVTDTQTGAVRTYTNSQFNSFQPIQDTSAFPSCP